MAVDPPVVPVSMDSKPCTILHKHTDGHSVKRIAFFIVAEWPEEIQTHCQIERE